ncbi:DUF1269 domain-containing protein [Nocardioides sp. CCNWLW239]|uniref:DUF1269 domain-containing protein n=1 Tax=Nocardioides sp. CCNWLW239 TaxID=3128902 RepID=UPI003019F6A7
MATLTVWKYDTTDGADEAVKNLEELVQQDLIVLEDAATVRWEVGKKKPKTRQLASTKALGAMSGTFWGMLFGLIFFVPLLGAAVGAAAGALSGSLTDVGIDDAFINKVRDQVTPGTSALFLMTSDAVIDKVREAMRGNEGELIFTNLSSEQEAALREVFAE